MKTPSRVPCFPPALLLAAIALFLGGCAGLVRNPPTTAGGEMLVVETEEIFVTGSHIPVLVPKSASARTAPTISPLTILTADDMRRLGGPSAPPMH